MTQRPMTSEFWLVTGIVVVIATLTGTLAFTIRSVSGEGWISVIVATASTSLISIMLTMFFVRERHR